MGNNRIYYPVHQVGIRPTDGSPYVAIHGVQQYSASTTFNLEQVFEAGQLSLYENIEEIPDVEINLVKVLDGYAPIITMATSGATNPELQQRVNIQSIVGVSIFEDTVSSTSGQTVQTVAESSGMFISSINYAFPIEGNFQESVTLMGNDRIWKGDASILNATDTGRADALTFAGAFDGTDSPQGDSGVNRRQDILFDFSSAWGLDSNGQVGDVDATILPRDILGVTSSGTNELGENGYGVHVSNIDVSVDLNLESLNELGAKGVYHKAANFPVQVTTQIDVTATSGDFVSATEGGVLTIDTTCTGDQGNLNTNTIRVALCEGLRLYMGVKNKLQSVNYGGGDAGGGNVDLSYTYTTFNDLTIMHTNDPAAL